MPETQQTSRLQLFRAGKLDDAVAAAQGRVRAKRRPISAPASCWASCWPSPATSNAPTWCSMRPRRSIRRRRSWWRNSASSSAPTWRGGSCSAMAGCPSSSPIRPRRSALQLGGAGGAARRRYRRGRAPARRGRGAPAARAGQPEAEGGEVAFDDLRDADDLLAGSFEVLTTTGKYFWIPTERVAALEFHPPKRPRDLLWRRASMSVDRRSGRRGLYPGDLRFGRPRSAGCVTGSAARPTGPTIEGGPVRGVGQRLFIVGEDAVPMMDLGNFRFAA